MTTRSWPVASFVPLQLDLPWSRSLTARPYPHFVSNRDAVCNLLLVAHTTSNQRIRLTTCYDLVLLPQTVSAAQLSIARITSQFIDRQLPVRVSLWPRRSLATTTRLRNLTRIQLMLVAPHLMDVLRPRIRIDYTCFAPIPPLPVSSRCMMQKAVFIHRSSPTRRRIHLGTMIRRHGRVKQALLSVNFWVLPPPCVPTRMIHMRA
jgi:hypothetical protein